MIASFKKALRSAVARLSLRLTVPREPEAPAGAYRLIRCRRGEYELVSETNAIFHVVTAGENGYFTPCRRHEPLREYVERFLDDYFSFITPHTQHAEADRQMVAASLAGAGDPEAFLRMGSPLDPASGVSRFLASGDPETIGLVFDASDTDLLARMKYFAGKYAWCQLNAYHVHSALASGRTQTISAGKSLATQALAGLLGLGELFPQAEYAYFQAEDHRKLFGLYTQRADGIGIIGISQERRREMLTPQFQRCMSCLNLLDAITHEMDHSPNNYFVVTDNSGKAVGLSVFDNNGIGTFSLNTSAAFTTYKHCSPFLREDGTVNRPHLDLELARRLQVLTKGQLTGALSPYLRPAQLHALRRRIRAVSDAISKTAELDPMFLLNTGDWSEKTIGLELSGRYGKTYLLSYLQDCCVPNE